MIFNSITITSAEHKNLLPLNSTFEIQFVQVGKSLFSACFFFRFFLRKEEKETTDKRSEKYRQKEYRVSETMLNSMEHTFDWCFTFLHGHHAVFRELSSSASDLFIS